MNWNAKRLWVLICMTSVAWGSAGVTAAEDAAEGGMNKSLSSAKEAAEAAREATRDAARRTAEGNSETAEAADLPAPIIYVPPPRGRAVHTAGAGTRGISGDDIRLAVVAPTDHVALTTRAQPTLYWFVSADTNTRIDITVTDENAIDPLLELTVPGPVKRGIHALRLADQGLELDADKTYHWSVALVSDAKRRSNDKFVEGYIARTPVTSVLEQSLESAQETFAPYALSGIWYDAMDELFGAIEKKPASRRLRRQQIALLEQANLSEVASYAVRRER